MQKFISSVRNYTWDNRTALTELCGMGNPSSQPIVELQVGVRPKSSPRVHDITGDIVSLRDVIGSDKATLLGDAVAKRFDELPFLFKVLYAAQPLSIQVHPNKHNSEIGLTRENAADIPMDTAERDHKDPNHKLELVFAPTPFLTMNALREFSEIVSSLRPIAGAHPAIAHFLQQPDAERLSELFVSLLNMQGEEESRAPAILKSALDNQQSEPWQAIRLISESYPKDNGLFSPLLLNMVKLSPSEAMFLFIETPHAYLQGVTLGVIANSDNVLHAGLAPRYVDTPELVANVRFETKPANQLLTQSAKQGARLDFPIPMGDLAFSLHDLSDRETTISQQSAAILLYVEDDVTLCKDSQQLQLKPSESAFIIASESPVAVKGHGRLARVYNKLQELTEKINISC